MFETQFWIITRGSGEHADTSEDAMTGFTCQWFDNRSPVGTHNEGYHT